MSRQFELPVMARFVRERPWRGARGRARTPFESVVWWQATHLAPAAAVPPDEWVPACAPWRDDETPASPPPRWQRSRLPIFEDAHRWLAARELLDKQAEP